MDVEIRAGWWFKRWENKARISDGAELRDSGVLLVWRIKLVLKIACWGMTCWVIYLLWVFNWKAEVTLAHFQLCCQVHLDGWLICTWKSKSAPKSHIRFLVVCCCCWFSFCSDSSNVQSALRLLFSRTLCGYRWTAVLGPSQLLATFVILMFYFILYPCFFALSSSSHPACAIQRCYILPVTRRLRPPCPRAPPPSLLSLWQPRAAQSLHKMPTSTRRASIPAAACGPRTALDVPSTAPPTVWTAPKQSPWRWSRQRARGTCLWGVTRLFRRATKPCLCPRRRSI